MKTNIFTKVFLFCALSLGFSSCIEEFNADLGDADHNIIVVEGNLYSDSLCVIYLNHGSSINDYINFNRTSINDAIVRVVGSDGMNCEGKRVGDGKYQVKTGPFAPNQEYSLEIDWDGATFKSVPATPNDAPDIEEARFLQPREDKTIDILVSAKPAASNEPEYYEWSYKETWELRAFFHAKYEYDPVENVIVPMEIDKTRGWKYGSYDNIIIANTSKYENNRIKDFRIFQIYNSDQRVSWLYRCDIKMHALSRAQYEYEEARREISDNMGGLFAPMPSELYSNIKSSDNTHRAIGYIGVCGKVASYRLWINRSSIDYNDVTNRDVKLITDENILALSDSAKYAGGYRVADEFHSDGQGWEWTVQKGVDVTVFGATLDKPEDWPN